MWSLLASTIAKFFVGLFGEWQKTHEAEQAGAAKAILKQEAIGDEQVNNASKARDAVVAHDANIGELHNAELLDPDCRDAK